MNTYYKVQFKDVLKDKREKNIYIVINADVLHPLP